MANLLGTNPRRVEGWVEQGFLLPAVRRRGSGRRHQFDLRNLVQAAILLELQGVIGDKSRFPTLVPVAIRPLAEQAAGILESEQDLKSSELVLLLAHATGIGPFVVKVGTLAQLQPFLAHALRREWLITLLGFAPLLSKIQSRLTEFKRSGRAM